MKYTLVALAALFLAAFSPGDTAYVQLVCKDKDVAIQIAEAFTVEDEAGKEAAMSAVDKDKCILLPFQAEAIVKQQEWTDNTNTVYSVNQPGFTQDWFVVSDAPGVKS